MNARPALEFLEENGAKDIAKYRKINASDKEFPVFFINHSDGKLEQIGLKTDKVHNEYLDYALTYGIPAALIFIFILGSAIWKSRFSAPGLSAGLIAYAAYLFTWPEIVRFAPIAWFMMGLALAAPQRQRDKVQP